MGKYRVKVLVTKVHEIDIDAEKIEDAIKIALCDYSGCFPISTDRQISNVELIEDMEKPNNTTNYWD